jgi:hypothetical protein
VRIKKGMAGHGMAGQGMAIRHLTSNKGGRGVARRESWESELDAGKNTEDVSLWHLFGF